MSNTAATTGPAIPSTQEQDMYTSEFISNRIDAFLAHVAKQAPPCPHFEAL